MTLKAVGIDANGNPGTPFTLATYDTGFHFQIATTAEPGDLTAVLWTAANGTYPGFALRRPRGPAGGQHRKAGELTGSAIEVKGGTLDLNGPVCGPISLLADAGGTLRLDHGAAAGAAFTFAGAATLQLGDVATFSGSIAHLGAGDAVDLTPVGYASGHVPTLAYAVGNGGGTLTVAGGGQSAKLALVGSYSQTGFHLAVDDHGGTFLSYG